MFASRSASRCFASALVALALVAAAAARVAAADDGSGFFSIATPAKWDRDIDLASKLATLLGQTVHLGDLEKTGGAAAYVKPGTGGLYISWLRATEQSDHPEAIIRESLDELRGSISEAGLEAGQVEELEYREKRGGNIIEAGMAWRHKENGTITLSHTFMWQNKKGLLRLLRGECLFAEDQRDSLQPICSRALASLMASEVAKGDVGELGKVAAPAEHSAAAPSADAGASSGSGPSEADLKKPLYASQDSKKSNRSNLWIFLVGAALIAFAFYAGTRTGRGASPKPPKPPAPSPPDSEEEERAIDPVAKEEEE